MINDVLVTDGYGVATAGEYWARWQRLHPGLRGEIREVDGRIFVGDWPAADGIWLDLVPNQDFIDTDEYPHAWRIRRIAEKTK